MLGVDLIKELTVRVRPDGKAIEILINGERVDNKHLNVQKIGFEFEKESDGYIKASCTRTIGEPVYSEKKMAAAALAGAKAAERDKALRDELRNEVGDFD